jgi:hypothetical protein
MPFLLAHGALGSWDEVIFLSIGAIFLVMMGISWLRSRSEDPDELDAPAPEATPEVSDTRFKLD